MPDLPSLPSLAAHRDVRLDLETNGLKWYAGDRPIGFSYLLPATGSKGYVPFGHLVGSNYDPDLVRRWMKAELAGKTITNVKTHFDVNMSRAFGVDLSALGCTFGDVAHNAALLDDNRRAFNLDVLSRDFLGNNPEYQKLRSVEGVTLDKTRMAHYPANLVGPYAIRDVELVDLLAVETERRLAEEDLLRVWQLENDVIPVVCEMEWNGAPIDLALLDRWIDETARELDNTIYEIYRITGIRFGGQSTLAGISRDDPKFPLDLIRRVFSVRNIPIPLAPDEDEPGKMVESFADDLLEPIQDRAIQLLRYALQLRSLRSKFLLRYRKIVGPDGLIRYALHQLASDEGGTVSGRFSSSGQDARKQAFGINIQQQFSIDNQLESLVAKWPVRRLFVPRIGKWTRADAKQVEYRLFAHYANSPKINAVYEKDREADFHDTVMDLLRTVIDIERKHTKNVNFAMVFGAGLGKFAEMCGLLDGYDEKGWPIPNAQAIKLYKAYNSMFPEVKPLLRRASDLATPSDGCNCKFQPCRKQHRGFVRTALGRRARFHSTGKVHSALNRVIQGTAASYNKRKLVEIYRNRDFLEQTMRFTVHDEYCGDARNPDKVPALVELLNEQSPIGEQNGQPVYSRIPLLWDTKAGESWAGEYLKKAETLHAKGKVSDESFAYLVANA